RIMSEANSAMRCVIFCAGFSLVLAGMALACSDQPLRPSLAPATGMPDPGASTAAVGASPLGGGVGIGVPTPTETTPATPAPPVAIVPVLPAGGPTAAPPAPP